MKIITLLGKQQTEENNKFDPEVLIFWCFDTGFHFKMIVKRSKRLGKGREKLFKSEV